MTENNTPGVIVRGMSLPKTCYACRFLLWSRCAAMEPGTPADVDVVSRLTGRREDCPLDPLPEEVHTDCRISFVPVWNDVQDEIPRDDRYVLCCCRNKAGEPNVVKGYYSHATGRWACGMNTNVTHWMEMPVPPRKEWTK